MLHRPTHKQIAVRRLAGEKRLTPARRRVLGLPPEPKRLVRDVPPLPAHPSLLVWFAFVTAPQKEARAAEEIWYRLGHWAFNPVENVEVRASQRAKYRRKTVKRALLTSMVLVGFKARMVSRRINGEMRDVLVADVPWLDLWQLPSVIDVLRMGQLPVPVPTARVIELMKQSGRPASTRKWAPKHGAKTLIEAGPFVGRQGEIIGLVDGMAKVKLLKLEGMFADLAEPVKVPETWLGEPEGVM